MNLDNKKLANFIYEMSVLMFLKQRNGSKTTSKDLIEEIKSFRKLMGIEIIPMGEILRVAEAKTEVSDLHQKASDLLREGTETDSGFCDICVDRNSFDKSCLIQKIRLSLIRESSDETLVSISMPEDVFNLGFLKEELLGLDREKFICLHLDTRNQVISYEVVAIGSLNATIVHPREVFKGAILANACSIIFCHNHPSGNPKPSPDDVRITKQMIDAGEILGIDVIDHIVFGNRNFFSFKERKYI